MREVFNKFKDFEWDNVDLIDYKTVGKGEKASFKNVKRQNIVKSDSDIGFDMRYFECGKGGYTSLERHEHVHVVLVLRGKGSIIVGEKAYVVEPYDLIVIPSQAVHQLVNTGAEPFGFVCTVNAERDKPLLLTQEEINELLKIPELKDIIRTKGGASCDL